MWSQWQWHTHHRRDSNGRGRVFGTNLISNEEKTHQGNGECCRFTVVNLASVEHVREQSFQPVQILDDKSDVPESLNHKPPSAADSLQRLRANHLRPLPSALATHAAVRLMTSCRCSPWRGPDPARCHRPDFKVGPIGVGLTGVWVDSGPAIDQALMV